MAHSYPQARKKVDRKEKYYDCVKNMKDILDYDLVLHVLLLQKTRKLLHETNDPYEPDQPQYF